MRRIRGKGSRPEVAVRSMIWNKGYRYRLHAGNLIGKPDIVFHSRRKVIFVHGCFWHRCRKCGNATVPKTNIGFWMEKFQANVRRDKEVSRTLRKMNWGILVIWECQIPDRKSVMRRVTSFLED